MRFGVSLPTCKEGLSLPLPFCDVEQLLELGRLAERLGYDSVWGNDHITPPAYVREDFAEPPRFFEPLIVLAALAAETDRVRLGTALLVLPMREPAYLAKQIATLDHLSRGRAVITVGSGAYREEFEALHPRQAGAHRGRMLDEGLEALELLFAEPRASYAGEYVAFEGIALYPKPAQQPFPIYVGGNHANSLRRAAQRAQGWMPAILAPEQLAAARGQLADAAEAAGRDPGAVDLAPQYMCCIASTQERALERFRSSRYYVHLKTLAASTLKGQDLERLEDVNLVGTPDEIVHRIGRLREVGIDHLPAISFISETPEAMAEDMQRFAEGVIGSYARAA
jgi:probable F420-dependent oxidoreductase